MGVVLLMFNLVTRLSVVLMLIQFLNSYFSFLLVLDSVVIVPCLESSPL